MKRIENFIFNNNDDIYKFNDNNNIETGNDITMGNNPFFEHL